MSIYINGYEADPALMSGDDVIPFVELAGQRDAWTTVDKFNTLLNTLPMSGGTANGVLYLNGSKVVTSGSALQFSGTALTVNLDGTSLVVGTGGASTTAASFQSTTRNQLRFPSGASFEWHEGVNELMRLTSTGLGIGTTSSAGTGQRIVHIAGAGGGVNQYGSLSMSNASGSGNNLLGSIDYYAASTLISAIRSVVTASGNTGDLRFFSASGGSLQQRAVIDSSGITVGLNNGTVNGFLTAYNSASASERTGLFIGNGATPAGSNISINLASLANDGQYYNLAKIIGFKTAGGSTTVSGGLIFSTNDNSSAATERMRLDQFGNLGIGTASPSAPLQFGKAVYGAPSDENFYRIKFSDAGGTANDAGIGQPAAGAMGFNVSDSTGYYQWNRGSAGELMRLDLSGNLGLGVTPSAWASARKALQIGQSGVLAASTNSQVLDLVSNAIVNSAGNTVYLVNGFASYYRQFDSVHTWAIAASGTAGNAISFTQAMTLDASGNLGIGATSPGRKLHIVSNGPLRMGQASDYFDFIQSNNNLWSWISDSSVICMQMNGATGAVVIGGLVNTTATDGFLYVPTCAGTPTGTPNTYTGRAPIVIDTTNNKLYFYSGGQWRDAGP